MFDSDEEFEARVGQGPSEILEQFLEGLPSTLRDSAVPLKHFTKEGFLAQGSFGRVFKATAPDGSFVALKKLSLHQFNKRRHEIAMKDSLREIQVLASLKHRNIIQLQQVVLGTSDVYLAIELCPVQLLDMVKRGLTKPLVKAITWQLLTGLKYLHECKLIHRDIKVDNLMLKEGILKIGDFGSTVSEKQEVWTPQVVTLWYRPPEILLGSPLQSSAVDIWSAGCVMAELILRRPLFCGQSELNQINLIVDLLGTPTEKDWPGLDSLPVMNCMVLNQRDRQLEETFADVATAATQRLLADMLTYNPQSRPSAADCLASEYFIEEPGMASESELAECCHSTESAFELKGKHVAVDPLDRDNSETSDSPVEKIRKRLRLDTVEMNSR